MHIFNMPPPLHDPPYFCTLINSVSIQKVLKCCIVRHLYLLTDDYLQIWRLQGSRTRHIKSYFTSTYHMTGIKVGRRGR